MAVTHRGVVCSSFLCLGDSPFRSIWLLFPENTSVTEWLVPVPTNETRQLGPDATVPPAQLVRYNDVSHLAVG